MKQPHNFIVLSTQRTGSTWLIDKLNSHPQIVAYSELLLDKGVGNQKWGGTLEYPFFSEYKKSVDKETDLALTDYLDILFKKDDASVGFKLMYNQLGAYPVVRKYIHENNIRIIHLYRKNLLDTYVSKLIAKQTQKYHSKSELDNEAFQITIDEQSLLEFIEKSKAEFKKHQGLFKGNILIEVAYEELIGDGGSFEAIQKFIGVPPIELKSELVKLIKQKKQDVIKNYEEVKRTLIANGYDIFL